MMKRKQMAMISNTVWKGFFLILFVVWGALVMKNQAMAASKNQSDWNLRIEQANQPGNQVVGEAFSPKGIVSSNEKLQNIFVVVYDANGKEMVSSLRTDLGVTRYDISNMDLDFTKLPVGKNYTYVVAARDAVGKKNLVKVTFNVEEDSTMHVEHFGYLNTLTKGNGFRIEGTLVSNHTIQTCYAAIYDQRGNVLVDKTVQPNEESFDLVNMTLSAEHLPAGTYVYRLAARDTVGRKSLACETLYITETDPYTQKMNEFISNDVWKNGADWAAEKRPTISGYSGSGCCAYAADFVKYVFGSDKVREGSSFSNPSEIRSGDVVYVSGTSHWFVVLKRDGDRLTTAEGNWLGKVVISDSAYTVSGNTLMRNGKKFRTFETGYHYQ